MSANRHQVPYVANNFMTDNDFAGRVKAALREAGLNISKLAELWGVDRSALSERINQDRMGEDELRELVRLVRKPKAWLRYGVEGDFVDGVRWAAGRLRAAADSLIIDAVRGGVIDTENEGEEETAVDAEKRRREKRPG